MFQSFDSAAQPDQGPPRLTSLRTALREDGLDGFIVPRADAHQGEYVAPRDDRLAWLTGFTGSAGLAIALPHIAGVFVDGRYRLQVRAQCDLSAFTPVDWPETSPAAWLIDQLDGPAQIGFDPWLHTVAEIARMRRALADTEITLVEVDNLIDRIWPDQPAPPKGKVSPYPEDLVGQSAQDKCLDLGKSLAQSGTDAAVITLPDSLCWLLNIRGQDIPRVPVAHGFAVLHRDGRVELFMDPAKLSLTELPDFVQLHAPDRFSGWLGSFDGTIRLDKASAPVAVHAALTAGPATLQFDRDPCILPKACKNDAELRAANAAHLRDAGAMVTFLAWLDRAVDAMLNGGPALNEIGVVRQLEALRVATGALKDISFDTICGTGPHGAIVHYRVTEDTNRQLAPGDLLLVDSGGQYLDGTTDITRTMAVGPVGPEERQCYTRVLKGMIAMSCARFPTGTRGRELDVLARMPLWQMGQDFAHGTGHGVGQYLSVHEGPQRLSRQSDEILRPGMILSNEPGYYREGAFGIRIENLIAVSTDEALPSADPGRDWLSFETLTFVPFDRHLIDTDLLSPAERDWIDDYHRETRARLAGSLEADAASWLETATRPL